KVHFHEVGALDAILDIVCSMAGIEALGYETFYTRPVALGSGWVDIAHGRFPVPAPATLRILEGVPVTGLQIEGECTTPTGAAIVATLTEGRQPPALLTPQCTGATGVGIVRRRPEGRQPPALLTPRRTGFGGGTRDPETHPNCVRLVACAPSGPPADRLVLLQADIDDLAPECAAPAQEAIMA